MPRTPKSQKKQEAAGGESAGAAADEVKAKSIAFLKSMYAAEESVARHRSDLTTEQWQDCIRSILTWLDTTEDIPKACLTRDIGREILAQLSAVVMISGYRGDPDSYIA